MKIVHLADTHLGFRQLHYTDDRGRNVREQDVYRIFTAAVDLIIKAKPACVVHAGDLFHGYHPSAAALGVALDQIARLREAEIPVVIIAGNHSTPRVAAADHIFALLERFGGVHAVHTEPRMITFGPLCVTAVPHCNDRDVLRQWITDAEPSRDARFNILMAHVGLDGLGHVGASEAGSIELSGETLEAVAEFDYIALGHLHKFDRPRTNAVYAGSLERLSWADDATRKGMVEVDLAADPLADGFITPHWLDGRKHVRLPDVDASQIDNLTKALIAAARKDDIDGAIVKLPIRGVTVESYSAIDRRQINTAFKGCLHLELDPDFVDAPSSGAGSAPQDLRDFLSQHVPRGVEPGDFIARAEAYMTRAAQEIGA